MSLWRKLFDRRRTESLTPLVVADDCWEKAIRAAERRQYNSAYELFRQAIALNPDYYISVIQPTGRGPQACWQRAVKDYIRHKDAHAEGPTTTENQCVVCAKNLGAEWHYFFESLTGGETVGTQCQKCNRTVCRDHTKFGSEGKYLFAPCEKCGAKVLEMRRGPAYSSLVEQGEREGRYRGIVRKPGVLKRPVIQE